MASTYRITSDLFVIPSADNTNILYAPRIGFLCYANADLINLLGNLDSINSECTTDAQKEVLDFLEKKGVLNGSKEYNCIRPISEKYRPTSVTLFPTNQCNLRCKYCYASAGEFKPKVMDWHFAVSAIERLIDIVKENGGKQVSVGFHGGGEPLYPWELIKRIVQFAKTRCSEEGLQAIFYAATNAVLSERQLEWIVQHFQSLNISFDGLPHVQDYHRPLVNGKGSFEFVDRTLRFLDQHKFSYGIRSTISSYNLELMQESIEFIKANYKAKTVHFEPLFYCGRCKTNGELNPDLKRFEDNFIKCESFSVNLGIQLVYSGCQVENLRNSFCGVSADNFSVTPDGFITACFEVTSQDDPKADCFFIGHIDKFGKLNIDERRRESLFGLRVENLAYCQDCFAKWHCAGECAAKLGHADYFGERGNERCQLNRALIRKRLQKILNGEKITPHTRFYNFQENEGAPKEIVKQKENDHVRQAE